MSTLVTEGEDPAILGFARTNSGPLMAHCCPLIASLIVSAVGLAPASVSWSRPAAVSSLARQDANPRTDSKKPLLTSPFDLLKGHVVLRVEVNARVSEEFILDSGASVDVLSSDVARKLGLCGKKSKGRHGVDQGRGEICSGGRISFSLGGREIFNGGVLIVDMSDLSKALGRRIGGILGLPFFKSHVVEIDYADAVLSLYDPRQPEYNGTARAVPIRWSGGVPFVKGVVVLGGGKRINAKLAVDTGSDDALVLNLPFEWKYHLPREGQVTIPTHELELGGDYEGREGRVKELRLGGFAIEEPLVMFSQAERGQSTRAKFDGRIGTKILEQFTAIFDFPRRHLILEPNIRFGQRLETDDVSGLHFGAMSLSSGGTATAVVTVTEGSPASLSGFRQGDQIIAIDGEKSTSFTLNDLRRLFSEEGKTFTLTIERDSKRMNLTFTTLQLRPP